MREGGAGEEEGVPLMERTDHDGLNRGEEATSTMNGKDDHSDEESESDIVYIGQERDDEIEGREAQNGSLNGGERNPPSALRNQSGTILGLHNVGAESTEEYNGNRVH